MLIGCDGSVTLLPGLLWHTGSMQQTMISMHSTFRHHAAWIFGGSLGAFALFLVCLIWLVSGTNDLPSQELRWVLLALVLVSSVVLGIGLLIGLHLKVLIPARDYMEEAEQLIDRARLMQSAMQPALDLIEEGIMNHERIVEDLRTGFPNTAKPPAGPAGKEYMMQRLLITDTMESLHADLSSRKRVAQTLIAANETIGKRLSELNDTLIAMNSVLTSSTGCSGKTKSDQASETPLGKMEVPLDPDLRGSLTLSPSASPGAPNKQGEGKNDLTWLDSTTKPLLSDFTFKDEQMKRRFEMN